MLIIIITRVPLINFKTKLKIYKIDITFFPLSTSVGGTRRVSRVVRQVSVGQVGRVTEMIRQRRVWIGRDGGGGRAVVVQRRQVPHARTLLDYRAIRQSHAEQP